MNALLIYPEFPDTFWSFKHALRFIRKKASSPPLGLLTVAAMLPSVWEKRLVDVNVTRLTAADLRWADYALISAMTVQRQSAQEIIARCREAGVAVFALERLRPRHPAQIEPGLPCRLVDRLPVSDEDRLDDPLRGQSRNGLQRARLGRLGERDTCGTGACPGEDGLQNAHASLESTRVNVSAGARERPPARTCHRASKRGGRYSSALTLHGRSASPLTRR